MGPLYDALMCVAPRRWTATALTVIALIVATTLTVVSFSPPKTTVAGISIERVVAPKPPAAAVAAGCPEMNNPGGRLDWTPVSDPGPVPTNGTVTLPSLRVTAPIVRVGIDADRLMVVPSNARDVGWLDQGGIPGRTNNVVLAGHIRYSGAAGTFSRLGELQPGAFVVVSIDERHLVYRVVWNCQFERDTNLVDHIMGYTKAPSVTLISCGGVFDTAARTHTERIAVRAELVSDADA
jgi:sortase (surface protein transpeptidase)